MCLNRTWSRCSAKQDLILNWFQNRVDLEMVHKIGLGLELMPKQDLIFLELVPKQDLILNWCLSRI